MDNVILQLKLPDKLVWKNDPGKGYLVNRAYQLLNLEDYNVRAPLSDLICNKVAPFKVSRFAWRTSNMRIPTKDNLVCQGAFIMVLHCAHVVVERWKQ